MVEKRETFFFPYETDSVIKFIIYTKILKNLVALLKYLN